ncbi:MAG: glycosyltransferase family 2 protein [Armatimonadota bacterium]|nr:glycosyltransferase family 2 protein [Armatimonadota bacterium]MDR7402610.1 glycosyltransferase family 2 protein [Armatimonadota bacterium]MDR7404544.1 glycosyltransferase family 2 protein [Armatimonadota bacterium]MDR7436788.1 glycosyltransferase family 2 protein [Armatimonadota bacterium]MDR7472735.1 glycosyltransferase family 2 protein [Armatimonadota bacterium]
MRSRSGSLVLVALAVLWVAGVAHSLRYRDLAWLRVVFVDVTWLQGLVLAVGGFGALMVLVGALSPRPRRPAPPDRLPFVSIVVPAKNEEAVIEGTVRSLCALDYAEGGRRRFEVIVVDDQSTDRTGVLLDRLAAELPVRVVRTPPGSVGKAAALNFGIARARGEVVAVFDADARVRPDFLRTMVALLDDPRVGGVQAQRQLYNAGQNLLTRVQDDEYRLFYHPLQRARRWLGGMVSFSGNGLLVRRDVLDEVGGWREEALTEDIDLTIRLHLAGWEIRYCEEAVVWEEAPPHLRDLLRQRVRWFEGALRCLGEHLPAILFGRMSLFKKLDMVVFLSGGLLVTLSLLTSYLYAALDAAGAVVLYLQLPRPLTTAASAALTVAVLTALGLQLQGRVWALMPVVVRSGIFSLHRLLVVPLAVHRFVRSAVTGHTTWEKTAHGLSLPRR